MQISLFTCRAETNRLDKTDFLSNRFVLDGTIKKPTSALNVVLEIQKTNPVLYQYNYMYIEEFGRYYFIDDIKSIHNNIWEILAHCDVLMSFKSDILSSTAIIDKTEDVTNANLYLDDGSFVMDTRKFNTIKEFPNGFNNNGTYILICAGG